MYVVKVFDKDTSNYLGIVFVHDDGYIMSKTEWGDFSYYFSSTGESILKFLTHINTDYLSRKVLMTWANNAPVMTDEVYKGMEGKAYMYADKILPSLQEAIKRGLYQVYEHTKDGQPLTEIQ